MIRKALAAYILPLILSGTGFIMPKDTSIQIYIGYACYMVAILIFGYSLFKNYCKKQNAKKLTNELPSVGLSLDKKINEQTCTWIQKPGIWKHKTTGIYYCSYCAPSPSPLSTDDNESWFCHKCKSGFGGCGAFSIDW